MEWAYVEGIANTGSASDKVDSRSSSHSRRWLFSLCSKNVFETVTQVIGRVVLWEGTLIIGFKVYRAHECNQMIARLCTTMNLISSVQPWKCWSNLNVRAAKSAAEKGLGVIDASCWYLD